MLFPIRDCKYKPQVILSLCLALNVGHSTSHAIKQWFLFVCIRMCIPVHLRWKNLLINSKFETIALKNWLANSCRHKNTACASSKVNFCIAGEAWQKETMLGSCSTSPIARRRGSYFQAAG